MQRNRLQEDPPGLLSPSFFREEMGLTLMMSLKKLWARPLCLPLSFPFESIHLDLLLRVLVFIKNGLQMEKPTNPLHFFQPEG